MLLHIHACMTSFHFLSYSQLVFKVTVLHLQAS